MRSLTQPMPIWLNQNSYNAANTAAAAVEAESEDLEQASQKSTTEATPLKEADATSDSCSSGKKAVSLSFR